MRGRPDRPSGKEDKARQTAFGFHSASTRAPRSAQAARDEAQVPVPRRPRHAIRIHPSPRQIAIPLDPGNLYIDEAARQVLERRLQIHLKMPLVLSVSDNRQTMISCRKTGSVLRARIHHMFLDADTEVVAALARYLVRHDRRASLLLGRYIEDNRIRIKSSRPRSASIRTAGEIHDLQTILTVVSRTYFGGDLDVTITWGKRAPRRRRRRTIKMGTYSQDERLIRIHPALDRTFVPRYFLEYVVFHEMLHHVLPSPTENGRMIFHNAAFRDREKTFPHYARALQWERDNISRLLRD